jgi:multimeric flavodoxin WrbA
MKIIGIAGSPKKKDSTSLFALNKALNKASQSGLETELIKLSEFNFSGCSDCNGLCRSQLGCSIDDDFTNILLPLLKQKEIKGIIISSPVYFASITAKLKAFIDRMVTFRRNDFYLKGLVGGAITVGNSRHGGQELAAIDIIKSLLIQGMIIVPDSPPTSHFGGLLWSGKDGGINKDLKGIQSAENLGKNIAETVRKLFS